MDENFLEVIGEIVLSAEENDAALGDCRSWLVMGEIQLGLDWERYS